MESQTGPRRALRHGLRVRHARGLFAIDDATVLAVRHAFDEHGELAAAVELRRHFAGSDGGAGHWAIAMTLITTAKLNGIEPLAWLTDVLRRVVHGDIRHHQLDQLLPWNWRPPGTTSLAAAA